MAESDGGHCMVTVCLGGPIAEGSWSSAPVLGRLKRVKTKWLAHRVGHLPSFSASLLMTGRGEAA